MLSFADSPGNLFNILGRLGKVIATLMTYEADQLVNLINENSGIVPQLDDEPDIQAIIGGSYIGTVNGPGSIGSLMQAMAVAVVNRKVFRDQPIYNLTLTQQNTQGAIYEIIRQMKEEGATVRKMIVTATPVPFANSVLNTGNGVVIASVIRPIDGLMLENSFPEEVTVLCTSDSYSGDATAGNEGFSITGVGNQPNVFAFDWPLGSDGNIGANAINGAADQTSGNFLVNSGWDAWTDGSPDNWEIVVGTAGTNIVQETGNTFGSGSAIKLVGDGSTLITFRQQFNSSDSAVGNSTILQTLSQFAMNVFARRDGVVPSQGVIAVELVDGGGVVINDAAGTPNQFLIDLTTLTVFYANTGSPFRTPEIMPSTYYLQFRMTTALESGRSVYLDLGALGGMSQLYVSGPYFAVFAGSVPFEDNDQTTVAITNSYGAGGSQNTFQCLLSKLLQTQQQDIIFPSSVLNTISDSLITD